MKKITKNVALIDGGRAYVTIFDSKDWFVDNRSSIIRMTKTDKYVEDMNYIFEKRVNHVIYVGLLVLMLKERD